MNAQQLNVALAQITAQLKVINYDGRTYKYDKQPLHDEGALLIRYRASRKVNADDLSKPVINLTVRLDEVLDLYDVTLTIFDGNINKMFESTYTGLYCDNFENFATL